MPPTSYPGAIDAFVNPDGATDNLDDPPHDEQHSDANDAIEAVETELGINPRGAHATVRARLDAIEQSGIQTYSPALTASTTDPNLGGDGSIEGTYIISSGLIYVWLIALFGTSGVSPGSGTYRFSLPFPIDTNLYPSNFTSGLAKGITLGPAVMRDQSAASNSINAAAVQDLSGSPTPNQLVNLATDPNASGALVTEADPWPWGNGDAISIGPIIYVPDLS